MSLKDLSALLRKHFGGYREDEGTFRKIGRYLNRLEFKFESKHTNSGVKYLVKMR